ncbi:DeoR family transcriptional regulator [Patescibacteria group bacterium]
MDEKFLTQLTSNLYRLTLLFPKKEPLRFKMREIGTDILEKTVKAKSSEYSVKSLPEIFKDIEILDNFFEVAMVQNWVSPKEILNLKQEYSILREELEKLMGAERPFEMAVMKVEEEEQEPVNIVMQISNRQQKIVDILKQKGRAQVGDFQDVFPQMSKRTIRRDFEKLVRHGLVERIGEKQDTYYIHKS